MFETFSLVAAIVAALSTILGGTIASGLLFKIADKLGFITGFSLQKFLDRYAPLPSPPIPAQSAGGRLQATDAMPPELVGRDQEYKRFETAKRHTLARLAEVSMRTLFANVNTLFANELHEKVLAGQ